MSVRHELGSAAWYEAVFAIVRELLSGEELIGSYAFSEEYLDAPAHLPRGTNGRTGWHFRIASGALTIESHPTDDADTVVIAEYAVVQPLASIPYSDAHGMKQVRDAAREALRSGRLRTRGKVTPSDRFPALAALHDRVAAVTRSAPAASESR
jgi:hypothetical protein